MVLVLYHYDERLFLLNTERLEIRRLRSDLITCYKLIKGSIDMVTNDFFTFNHNSTTRGHQLKLFVPDSRINARAHFFVSELYPHGTICLTMLYVLVI